jgi:hypothetical protein
MEDEFVESEKPTEVVATIIDYIANIQLHAGSGDVAIKATQSANVSDKAVYLSSASHTKIFVATPDTNTRDTRKVVKS